MPWTSAPPYQPWTTIAAVIAASATITISWQFVRDLQVAVPAGFLAAWPVNYWLLGRELKACH